MAEDNRERSREKLLLRACESCRTMKVRCHQDTLTSSISCRSCIDAQRPCIFKESGRKRPRKRTDIRVAELEKEVKALASALKEGNSGQIPSIGKDDGKIIGDRYDGDRAMTGINIGSPNGFISSATQRTSYLPQDRSRSDDLIRAEQQLTSMLNSEASWTCVTPSNASIFKLNYQNVATLDVVDRGVLSMEVASHLFTKYVDNLVPQFPAVILPPGSTATYIRKTKPILFLAIVTAAAGPSNPALNLILNKEFRQLYADRVIVQGEKSLELIQSILIMAIWYCPPEKFNEVVFYQYIHIAATMALDIGLGKAPPGSSKCASPPPEALLNDPTSCHDSGTIENRRTLLSCYITSAGVSMTLRRPNILSFTPWMAECVSFLETSREAVFTDMQLTSWVRLRRIMEECSTSFALDDPSATVSLEDPRIQLMLKGFEKLLTNWNDTLPVGVMNETLLIDFHVHNIILHEIAMHLDHGVESFQPPYLIRTALHAEVGRELPPAYVSALKVCLSSTLDLLDAFLHASIGALCSFPIINYVRMAYATTVLIKLSLSVSNPSSMVGKILDQMSIRLGQYLEDLLEHLTRVVRCSQNRVASKFLAILARLKEWYGQQQMQSGPNSKHKTSIEPLMHLGPQLSELVLERQYTFDDIISSQILFDAFQEMEDTGKRHDTFMCNTSELEYTTPRILSGSRQPDLPPNTPFRLI